MRALSKRKVAAIGCVIAAASFAGGAYAAAHDATPGGVSRTFLDDVAKRLGVSPSRLRSAIRSALFDRLDAAVAAGRITQAQANRIKQRVQRDPNFPLGFGFGPLAPGLGPPFFAPRLFGAPRPFGGPLAGPGPRAGIFARAARYLGLSDAQLLAQLRSGKSLAQIATGRGKSIAGLEDAMIGPLRARLDSAVKAKRLSAEQERRLLSRLSARLDRLVHRQPPLSPRVSSGATGPAGAAGAATGPGAGATGPAGAAGGPGDPGPPYWGPVS